MNRCYTFVILSVSALLLFSPEASAKKAKQSNPPQSTKIHIDKIIVTGTEVTKSEIILRELSIQPDQDVDADMIEAAKLRLMNLNLFNRVDVFPMKMPDNTTLVIAVTERFYIFPLPYANWIGPNSDDYEYGFRYLQNNFRGMNRTISSSAWSGLTKGFLFEYSDPWLAWTSGYGYAVQIGYTTWMEPVAEEKGTYKRERFIAVGSVAKRYSPILSSRVYLGTQRMRVQPSLTLSGLSYDEMYLGKIEATQDRRDLIELPHRGDYINPWIDLMLFKTPARIRVTIGVDLRRYLPLSDDWTLSLQATGIGISGVSPRYMQAALGDPVAIRGNPDLLKAGDYIGKVAGDLRYLVYPIHYWSWHNAPKWLLKHTRNLKYGLSVSAFNEVGQAMSKQDKLLGQRSFWGYGVALTMTVPYVNTFRLDCGFNPGAKFHPNWKASIRAGL